jgi:hypothetical protein
MDLQRLLKKSLLSLQRFLTENRCKTHLQGFSAKNHCKLNNNFFNNRCKCIYIGF